MARASLTSAEARGVPCLEVLWLEGGGVVLCLEVTCVLLWLDD